MLNRYIDSIGDVKEPVVDYRINPEINLTDT